MCVAVAVTCLEGKRIKNLNQERLLAFQNKIQTHKRFKRTLFIRTKTQHANFRGTSLYQATKLRLNNSYTAKNDEKMRWSSSPSHFFIVFRRVTVV